ncbi:unnamed protein product [Caenorhabditis auriculariae]|uniref:Uncharacterized protein n=1 Tax=Caenorhabditis auriculariae TaxID=2777116 RepID=A0A8S1HAD4_9PELO|nr:unnamed protein product [Caenorhabditis auriculariae]
MTSEAVELNLAAKGKPAGGGGFGCQSLRPNFGTFALDGSSLRSSLFGTFLALLEAFLRKVEAVSALVPQPVVYYTTDGRCHPQQEVSTAFLVLPHPSFTLSFRSIPFFLTELRDNQLRERRTSWRNG